MLGVCHASSGCRCSLTLNLRMPSSRTLIFMRPRLAPAKMASASHLKVPTSKGIAPNLKGQYLGTLPTGEQGRLINSLDEVGPFLHAADLHPKYVPPPLFLPPHMPPQHTHTPCSPHLVRYLKVETKSTIAQRTAVCIHDFLIPDWCCAVRVLIVDARPSNRLPEDPRRRIS